MKRFLPYILIFSVVLQFFAPFTVGNGGVANKSIALGETLEDKNNSFERVTWDIDGYINAFSGSTLSSNGSIYYKNSNSSELTLAVTMDTGVPEGKSAWGNWWHVKRGKEGVVEWLERGSELLGAGLSFPNFKEEENLILFIEEGDTKKTGYVDITKDILSGYLKQGRNPPAEVDATPVKITKSINIHQNITPVGSDGISFLSPGKRYKISFYYLSSIEDFSVEHPELPPPGTAEKLAGLEKNGPYYIKIAFGEFPVASEKEEQITTPLEDQIEGGQVAGAQGDNTPSCSITDGWPGLLGCLIKIIHFLVYKPTAALFALAGQAMDIVLMYSVSDLAYRSSFISEGWKIIRDLCNMFFIFILLYIAFKTILDTGGAKTKSTVINVVIIGLFINFSLFATHLIIDASNILARVFYSPEVMKIETSENSEPKTELGVIGEIKVSEAIVSKINPQKLLQNQDSGDTEEKISTGNYLLIEILAIAVNITGMFIFISICFSLIGRVAGLWMAMILSPLAFLTFTIPELKNVDYIGWSKWWTEVLKASFMAPVFVFFLYIIAVFIDSGMGLKNLGSSDNGINNVLSVIISFALVMFLLNTAKKVAVGMAGKMAEQFSGALKTAGGLALGATMGLGSLAARSTLGKLGAGIMNSEKLKEQELKGGFQGMAAKQLRSLGGVASKSSFDIRNTKAGKKLDKGLDVDTGKGVGSGGYVKAVETKQKKKEEWAKTLELGKNSQEAKTLRETEERLETTKESLLSPETEEKLNKEIEEAKEEFKDAQAKYLADNTEENKKAMDQAEAKYKAKKEEKKNIREGSEKEDGSFNTDNGNITQSEYDKRKEAADKAADVEKTDKEEASKKEQEAIKKASEDYTKTENEEKEKLTAARIAAGEKKRAAQEKAAREYDEAVIKYSQVQTAFNGSTNPEDQQLVIDAKNKMDAAKNKMDTIKIQSERTERDDIYKAENDKRTNIKNAAIVRTKALASAQDEKDQAERKAEEKSKKTEELFEKAKERSNNGNTFGKSIKELSAEVRDKKQNIDKINRQRKVQYAGTVRRETIFDSISTGGQYRSNDADIAAHNIIMSTRQRN